jgi:hypothetical protein
LLTAIRGESALSSALTLQDDGIEGAGVFASSFGRRICRALTRVDTLPSLPAIFGSSQSLTRFSSSASFEPSSGPPSASSNALRAYAALLDRLVHLVEPAHFCELIPDDGAISYVHFPLLQKYAYISLIMLLRSCISDFSPLISSVRSRCRTPNARAPTSNASRTSSSATKVCVRLSLSLLLSRRLIVFMVSAHFSGLVPLFHVFPISFFAHARRSKHGNTRAARSFLLIQSQDIISPSPNIISPTLV